MYNRGGTYFRWIIEQAQFIREEKYLEGSRVANRLYTNSLLRDAIVDAFTDLAYIDEGSVLGAADSVHQSLQSSDHPQQPAWHFSPMQEPPVDLDCGPSI